MPFKDNEYGEWYGYAEDEIESIVSSVQIPKYQNVVKQFHKQREQLINDMESETPKLMDNVFNYYQIEYKRKKWRVAKIIN